MGISIFEMPHVVSPFFFSSDTWWVPTRYSLRIMRKIWIFIFFGAGILAHHQNRQTSNSFKLFGKQNRCITKLTEKKQKNILHVVMCKYYSSYMVIIYAPSSKQARSTWRMMMYLNRDMDGGPFLIYFLPILGGQKTAVSNLGEGWCVAPGLFPSHYFLIYVLFPSYSWWAETCSVRLSKGMVCRRQPRSFQGVHPHGRSDGWTEGRWWDGWHDARIQGRLHFSSRRPLLYVILGGQKAAVSDSAEGWCAAGNLGASRVSIRMDDRTNGQRTDDRTHGFRGAFISHPDVL